MTVKSQKNRECRKGSSQAQQSRSCQKRAFSNSKKPRPTSRMRTLVFRAASDLGAYGSNSPLASDNNGAYDRNFRKMSSALKRSSELLNHIFSCATIPARKSKVDNFVFGRPFDDNVDLSNASKSAKIEFGSRLQSSLGPCSDILSPICIDETPAFERAWN